MDSLIEQALGATVIVKILVDALKLAVPKGMPDWMPPALAIFGGPITVFLLKVSDGQPASPQLLASSILAGILAGGAAIGVSELAKRASKSVYLKVGEK